MVFEGQVGYVVGKDDLEHGAPKEGGAGQVLVDGQAAEWLGRQHTGISAQPEALFPEQATQRKTLKEEFINF